MTDRISCCVPFCRHTRGQRKGEPPITENTEWICGDHYRLVPRYIRSRRAKLDRLYAKRYGDNGYWTYPPGSPQRLGAIKLDRLCSKSWERCKSAAIEAAGGI